MKAIFNGELLDLNQIQPGIMDRGFRYGDGFFETIAVIRSNPRFLDRHFNRIVQACKTLRFDIQKFTIENLQENCGILLRANAIEDFGKVRLTIWRKDGGLYVPTSSEINFLLTAEPVDPPFFREVSVVGFSEKVVNYPGIYTPFKTISALKYVLAGLEKKERGLEEIVINDHNGFFSEALESNLFIKKDGVYFTPPLATGCIEGIMRSWLMNELKSNQIPIEERFMIHNEMLEAEAVFTTNTLGIKHIMQIGNSKFKADKYVQELFDSIN